MNDHDIIETLREAGEKGERGAHREALRRALLSVHGRGSARHSLPIAAAIMTRIMPAGALVALALVLTLGLGISDTPVAEAQELVQKSIARAKEITPEMRAQLESFIKADMMQTLEEAYAAPDLRILTPEEYEKEGLFTISTTAPHGVFAIRSADVAGPMHEVVSDARTVSFTAKTEPGAPDAAYGTMANVEWEGEAGERIDLPQPKPPVKYLSYTSPRGSSVVLGLDESDTPVFRIEELTAEDVMHGPNGEIGIKGTVIKMINVEEVR